VSLPRPPAGWPTVTVAPDAESASALAAARIAATLASGVAQRGRADWATTGGSTPVGIYRALRAGHRTSVPWERVHLWWGDDRVVPRDDPRSNARAAHDELIAGRPPAGIGDGLALAARHVHELPIGPALEAARGDALTAAGLAASAAAIDLADAGLALDPSGFPILDVVLVGIGSDGHLLSVFPGSAAWDDPAWVQPVPAPSHIEPRVARVTLHPGLLRAARLPLIVAHGGGKAAILATVFGAERDPRRWPAQAALEPRAVWVLDEAAAAGLPPGVPLERA
jgi:6-phosphogluconolactonase